MKKKIILIIMGILLIIIAYLINIYNLYRFLLLCLGILLITLSIISKKSNLFLIIYISILLFVITYSIDYVNTYLFNFRPIFAIENKTNAKVSVINSLFYRQYKCEDQYIFDNNYELSFPCETSLVQDIDINKLLNEPAVSYQKYHHQFIKVTGKISKINGNSNIELKEYTLVDNSINGYVKFNDASKLIIKVSDDVIDHYKIYDYITVVGLLNSYDKKNNTLTLKDIKIEDNKKYNNYVIEVIEDDKCSKDALEYIQDYYTFCLKNIYINYGFDKYELAYLIKDGKINLEDILKIDIEDNKDNFYKLDKFNILSCHNGKKYLLTKDELEDYTLCDE